MSRLPVAAAAVFVALIAVHFWQTGLAPYREMQAVFSLGVIPAHLWGIRTPAPQLDMVPPVATLLTAQVLHGGVAHLIGNLAAFGFVGPPAEARTGAMRLLAIFFVAGALGLLVEAATTPTSMTPILGASASVAGIIGAVARRDPRAHVHLTVPGRRFRLRRLAIPLLPLVAVWLVVQVAGIAFEEGEPVAFLAHATGFIIGALMAGPGLGGPRGRDPNLVDLRNRG